MLDFVGKLHLLLLHLPIGFLLLGFMLALAAHRRAPALRPAVGFTLFWGMISSFAAAVPGYLLSRQSDYDEQLLFWHQWLGIGTAVLSAAVYLLHRRQGQESSYFLPALGFTVLSLALTGHFGGSLTHGSGFLFENSGGELQTASTALNLDSAEVFADVVLPVLKQKCGNCHSPSKRKGGLAILTKEDILKGGENGPIIAADNPSNSSLLKTISLPPDDDYHMPPKGKTQLTDAEKQLLEWWIGAGAPFGKTVAECGMPESIRTVLLANVKPAGSPLDALKLEAVNTGKLKKLREAGISANPLAKESPFLQVNLAGRKDLSADLMKKLKDLGEHVTQLNLGHSNADDALLAEAVKLMPHLNRLHLEQTTVTDAGLASLSSLNFLEYLNLHQTAITDAGLEPLLALPHLRSLYLWQTRVTAAGIDRFAARKNGVFINKGIENDSIFGEVGLKPPTFKTTNELFTDSLAVELEAGFGNSEVRYTLDGADPDSTSSLYTSPFSITTTTEVKARAFKKGWTASELSSRQFVKVRYKPAGIRLERGPSERYADKGPQTLADFARGGATFRTGGWLGFEGEHCTAYIDLGKAEEVSRVAVSAYEDTGSWIFFPKGLRISSSADGKNYKKIKEMNYAVAEGPTQPGSKIFAPAFEAVRARYFKVEVLSAMKNPKWHPGAGSPCWVFVDEIMLE